MSLHAQLTPEAQAKLAAQQRASTASSIVIALLVVALLAALLGYIALKVIPLASPGITIIQPTEPTDPPIDKPNPVQNLRNPSPPSQNITRVLHTLIPSKASIPVSETNPDEPSTDYGNGKDFGNGIGDEGDGKGPGDRFEPILPPPGKRCSKQDRLQRLLSHGGSEKCEDAVVEGLRWLKATQNKDGSWGNRHRVAMTGLALLAYLGHCETPYSEEFGESVTAAIVYLVDTAMKNDGRMADDFKDKHWCYDHAIATYALGETLSFCKAIQLDLAGLDTAVDKAAAWIVDNQHSTSGGWDYLYDRSGPRGGDVSITAWHVQALNAARHAGFTHQKLRATERAALEYIGKCQTESGAIGYANAAIKATTGSTLAGAGAFCYQILGKGGKVPRKACNYIDKEAQFHYDTEQADLYELYYNANSLMQHGGPKWTKFNRLFLESLLAGQDKDGSWKIPGGGKKILAVAPAFADADATGKHYRTTLAILTLETYYRYLPSTEGK